MYKQYVFIADIIYIIYYTVPMKHELQTRTRRPNIEPLPGPFLHSSAARLIVLASSSSSPSPSPSYYYYNYYRSTITRPNRRRADSLPILLFLSLSHSPLSRNRILCIIEILCAMFVEDYNNTYYYCTPAMCHPVLRSRKDCLRTQRWHGQEV